MKCKVASEALFLTPGICTILKQGFFFEVVKPRVTYLIQRFISKVFQEGFVVNHDDEVVASQNKVFDLVKGIHYSQGLSLNWCISGFCRVSKSTAH